MDTQHTDESNAPKQDNTSEGEPQWTYPLRTCRICLEEVPATVTMYPPGLPARFQTAQVEYKNSDEYGRLLRPCMCKGGMRYIHELCLLQSRVEGRSSSAAWKCPTCSHKFSFRRIRAQHILESRSANVAITVVVLLLLVFLLGFVADPLLNLYLDPFDTIKYGEYWQQVDISDLEENTRWTAHFAKGLITMGLAGFLKTMLASPWNWWNLRGMMWGGRTRTGNTGRERVGYVGWIAVVMGILTAFYFFYQWVQSIVARTLHRIGNNIVDTSLPGDDDDIKPPPGFRHQTDEVQSENTEAEGLDGTSQKEDVQDDWLLVQESAEDNAKHNVNEASQNGTTMGRSSGIDAIHSQGWSFQGI